VVKDLYKVSSIQLQRWSSRNSWQCVPESSEISPSNSPQSLEVEMAHCVQTTTHKLRIVKHYDCTDTDVISEEMKLDQQSIGQLLKFVLNEHHCLS